MLGVVCGIPRFSGFRLQANFTPHLRNRRMRKGCAYAQSGAATGYKLPSPFRQNRLGNTCAIIVNINFQNGFDASILAFTLTEERRHSARLRYYQADSLLRNWDCHQRRCRMSLTQPQDLFNTVFHCESPTNFLPLPEAKYLPTFGFSRQNHNALIYPR